MKRLLLPLVCVVLAASAAHAQKRADSQVQVLDNTYGVLSAGQLLVTPTGAAQTTLSAALAAIGSGGPAFTQQITQSVSNSAYSAGQAVGGLMTFNASAHSPAYSGQVASMSISLPDAQTPTLDVIVFNANPTTSTITNGQAIVISAADQAKQIGVLHISDCTGYSAPTFCQSQQFPALFNMSGATSTTLYAAIVARNAFTPGNLPLGSPAWIVTMFTNQN